MDEILAIVGDLEIARRFLTKKLQEAEARIAELEALLPPDEEEK